MNLCSIFVAYVVKTPKYIKNFMNFFTCAFKVGQSGNQGIKNILNDPHNNICYIMAKPFFKDEQFTKVIVAVMAHALLNQ